MRAALDEAATCHGEPLGVDGPALLRARERLLGIAPAGPVSAGGTCRLLPARDGWVALNLARRDDVELLAAWMGREWDGPPWDAVAAALVTMRAVPAVERAQLLGIPAAHAVSPRVAAADEQARARGSAGVVVHDAGGRRTRTGPVLVADLSALWAGPLCAQLLRGTGARVVKVESTDRPDGARAGPPAFFEELNAGKEELRLDLRTPAGRAGLGELLGAADAVVTSSRPRAIEQLGLDPATHVARGAVWVSITGYGRSGPWRDRVAFGDDAAVAGGAAIAAGGPDAPVLVGDAVADPLAGLAAAAAAHAALLAGGGRLLDVAMRAVVGEALLGRGFDR